MASKKKTTRRKSQSNNRKTRKRAEARPKDQPDPLDPGEERSSVAVTVAWMVSLTTMLLAEVAYVLASLYVRMNPDSKKMPFLESLMLFAATVVGVISLVLLVVTCRVRRVPPPHGLIVFSVCAAIGPLVAILAKALG